MTIKLIPGFDNLTRQQMFDISLAHIRSTRKKSKEGANCVYTGSGCAAAPFIEPENRAAMDDWDASAAWLGLIRGHGVSSHEADFVTELQKCHDRATDDDFMYSYERRMERLARNCGLTYIPEA